MDIHVKALRGVVFDLKVFSSMRQTMVNAYGPQLYEFMPNTKKMSFYRVRSLYTLIKHRILLHVIVEEFNRYLFQIKKKFKKLARNFNGM